MLPSPPSTPRNRTLCPHTTRFRSLRVESLILVRLLSAGSIASAGGIKTAAGGSGYGSLQLLLNENYGLYEGSIMSTVGIAIIPLILWYRRHGTIFPPDRRVTIGRASCRETGCPYG